jgi:hypothetical protein
VTFDETSSQKWTYNLHYNVTGNPEFRDLYGFDEDEPKRAEFEVESKGKFAKSYKSGMFYLVNFIDTEILRIESGAPAASINTKIALAPTPKYKTSGIYTNF